MGRAQVPAPVSGIAGWTPRRAIAAPCCPIREAPRVLAISDDEPEHSGSQCHICRKILPDRRALAVHLARRHQMDAPSTQVAFGARCEACCVEFWTTDRLCMHLRKNRSCFSVYDHRDMTREPAQEKVDRLVHADRPAVRAAGPQPWWAQLLSSLHFCLLFR